MCVMFPELWDEFNGKCPSAEVFKYKYEGKDVFHNIFIEELYLDELSMKTHEFQKQLSINIQRKVLEDQFMKNVPKGRLTDICFSLVYEKYS